MKNTKLTLIALTMVLASTLTEAGASDAIRRAMTKLLCQLFDVFQIMAGVIGVLVIVMSGATWVSEADDPKKRDQARDNIIYVFMALILIVIAKSLVLAVLGGKGSICVGNEINIP